MIIAIKKLTKIMLSSGAILFLLVVSIFITFIYAHSKGYKLAEQHLAPRYDTISTADMVGLINIEREREGLKSLKESPILDKTAKIKACDMLTGNYFAHEDLKGQKSWHLFRENGYDYQYSGENLSENYGVFESMRLFMKSPAHRENILMPEYREVGVGTCGKYTVQHFGAK